MNNSCDLDRRQTHGLINEKLEEIGPYVTNTATAALGYLAGSGRLSGALRRVGLQRLAGLHGVRGKTIGTLAGLLTGVTANQLSSLKAYFDRERTREDQINRDSKPRLSNLLIPGIANYNAIKRKEREKITSWY